MRDIDRTAWAVIILLFLTLILPTTTPVFAQSFFWDPTTNGPFSPVTDLPKSTISADMRVDYSTEGFICLKGPKDEVIPIAVYSDLKNNTIKINCQWNPWIPEGERQFTAFYNDRIIVGLCPFNSAANSHSVFTNEEGEISRVTWLSVRTNGSDYVQYNTTLG